MYTYALGVEGFLLESDAQNCTLLQFVSDN